jgi:hypothetical protein
MSYPLLADLVLIVHVGVVLFVVGGLAAVPIGNHRGWRWVTGWWFRLAHLAAIAVVVLQAWLGQLCPLTILESWLRKQAGAEGYAIGFVAHWLQRLLYFDAPPLAFAAAYTVFALLVLLAWWRYPPRR